MENHNLKDLKFILYFQTKKDLPSIIVNLYSNLIVMVVGKMNMATITMLMASQMNNLKMLN